jgi:hypothetical protein
MNIAYARSRLNTLIQDIFVRHNEGAEQREHPATGDENFEAMASGRLEGDLEEPTGCTSL